MSEESKISKVLNYISAMTMPIVTFVIIFWVIWILKGGSISANSLKVSKEEFIRLENTVNVYHNESIEQINAIHQEMKDFHGRLCAIEERNKSK